MKKYTKKALLALCVFALLLAAGCGAKQDEAVSPEGTPSEVIDKIYEKQEPGIMVGTTVLDTANSDNMKYYLGLDDASNVAEAAVSEAMISSQAYSLAVVRVSDESKAQETAQAIKDGVDPAKWICVVADDIKVSVCGDTIMLIMVSTALSDTVTAQQIADAFKSVCGGAVTAELA